MPITIRPATPADVYDAAQISFEAFRTDELEQWLRPRLLQYPHSMLRSNILTSKTRMYQLGSVLLVAIDSDHTPPSIVGSATWSRKGSDAYATTLLNERRSWWHTLNRTLLWVEHVHHSWLLDTSLSWARAQEFSRSVAHFPDLGSLEEYWHLSALAVPPQYQRRGIGQMLMEWGMEKAKTENVPCLLESSPQGLRLYERMGWKTFERGYCADLQPGCAMIWEPVGLEGTWTVETGNGEVRLKGGKFR